MQGTPTPYAPWSMTKPPSVLIAQVAMCAAAALTIVAGPLSLLFAWDDVRRNLEQSLAEDGNPDMVGPALAMGVVLVVGAATVVAGLWLVMAFFTGRGAEWSRILGSALFVLYALFSSCWLISVADPVPLIGNLVTMVCAVTAVVCIWLPSATTWYRRPRR